MTVHAAEKGKTWHKSTSSATRNGHVSTPDHKLVTSTHTLSASLNAKAYGSMMKSVFAKSRFPRNSSVKFEFARQIALRVANSTFRALEIVEQSGSPTKSLEYSRAESQTSGARFLRSRSRLLLNASYWRSIRSSCSKRSSLSLFFSFFYLPPENLFKFSPILRTLAGHDVLCLYVFCACHHPSRS